MEAKDNDTQGNGQVVTRHYHLPAISQGFP